MTAIEFMQRCIYTFEDWPTRNPDGTENVKETYKKERLMKKLSEDYEEDELDDLWEKVEEQCRFRPKVSEIKKIMKGSKAKVKKSGRFVPSTFGLEDEYTTETGKFLGRGLADFMKPHKMDSKGSLHEMTEEDEQELLARSCLFWDKLANGLRKVPQRIKEKVFYPERCKGCGRRIGDEREKELAYCNGCGTNILNPLNVMRDIGDDQIGIALAEKIKPREGVRELRI